MLIQIWKKNLKSRILQQNCRNFQCCQNCQVCPEGWKYTKQNQSFEYLLQIFFQNSFQPILDLYFRRQGWERDQGQLIALLSQTVESHCTYDLTRLLAYICSSYQCLHTGLAQFLFWTTIWCRYFLLYFSNWNSNRTSVGLFEEFHYVLFKIQTSLIKITQAWSNWLLMLSYDF